MLSIKEMRALAASLNAEKFKKQMGPFALIRRPMKEDSLTETQKMGLPSGAQHTAMARPENISRGILSLLFEFDTLEVSTLPPLRGADELTVGRLPDCDLVIDHKSVSKRHAVLRWDAPAKRCSVRDLGSTNGTFLNDAQISTRDCNLRDGDIISFGEIQFWFVMTETLHARLSARGSAGDRT